MWKRFQGHGRERERQIGSPVLVETTYDVDQLKQIPSVTRAQHATRQSQFSAGEGYSHLNHPQSMHVHSGYGHANHPSVSSSVYSQPQYPPNTDYRYDAPPDSTGPEISPPSSPDLDDHNRDPSQPRRFRSMRDVSPVDEHRGQRHARSNIPVLRKGPPGLHDDTPPKTEKFWGGKVAPSSEVRWDEYSGEPTSGNEGRPGQVHPRSYARDSLSAPSPPTQSAQYTHSNTHAGHKKGTFAERAGRIATRPPALDTTFQPREPWKGASGRVEIVKPFRDQAAKQSPREFQRKPEPKAVKANARSVSSPVPSPVQHGPGNADTAPVSDTETIRPPAPLKAGKNSPPRIVASPRSPQNPVQPILGSPIVLGPQFAPRSRSRSPFTPTDRQPVAVKHPELDAAAAEPPPPARPKTPVDNPPAPQQSADNTPGSNASKDQGLSSRFSWTTYNTSTTYQHSPPPSPPPPLPAANPAFAQNPISAASSILNRRRPIPPVSDKVTARKPLSRAASIATTKTATTTRNASMPHRDPSRTPSPTPTTDTTFTWATTETSNTAKALPAPPTLASATSHVSTLEASLEDIRIQRQNIHRLLHDLNTSAPPNPLLTDFKRMRLVEARRKDFEDQLAKLKVEEHDVGLRLHRALKRAEREDPDAGTSALWIRRVTS
ncbi:hypothetical protein M011DRAFT_476694 [Sporormia fimetaria CBS 119925]|uniref:Uncharacterized protein n=1 Tax=Sporormia fimetaria CBS 119925 TaxID=1340428 RepID=A0A6A6VBY5_9PLEO|nr:hypothetical protein M011DRAFT_476694 [Sporormia fimetaria CBS 119925]